jgi:hypothetical protein
MNRSTLSKQINKEQIDSLKNNTKAFLTFLQTKNDGTIIYVLEKLGRLKNGYSKQPLLNLLNNKNETIRSLALKNLAKIGDVFWTKFEQFLTKILKTNLDSAGQTIFLGEWNCPASAFFPPAGGVWGGMRAGFRTFPFSLPNFVFCKAKCATKRDVALDPPNPFAGNAKELPKIFL